LQEFEMENVATAAPSVVVAMSGGVDSAAAALLLAEQGFNVIGISMQVWDYRNNQGNAKKATCCAPADFDDARTVADAKGFPYYVFDFEESFHEAVIAPFVKSYLSGYTPNPCIECNRKVKFSQLRQRAASLGVRTVATGHYAQIKVLADNSLGLFTGRDEAKDQSYFLYAMTQSDLQQTLFPVGGMCKPEVREYLRSRGFEIASKEESQDICFVSGDVGSFVEGQSKLAPKTGSIVNLSGKVLGTHSGIHHYTVGQRKGLGVSNPSPLFVLELDPASNNVVVGEQEQLKRESFIVRDVSWCNSQPSAKIRARVKLRYRHQGVLCDLEPFAENCWKGTFVDSWTPVTPGQAAVFYAVESDPEGDFQVFGGGTIERPE